VDDSVLSHSSPAMTLSTHLDRQALQDALTKPGRVLNYETQAFGLL